MKTNESDLNLFRYLSVCILTYIVVQGSVSLAKPCTVLLGSSCAAMSAEYRVIARAASELANAARVEKITGLTLEVIMRRFSAPLGELQAWAVCYQCVKGLLALSSPHTVRDISMRNVVAALDGAVYFTPGITLLCCC